MPNTGASVSHYYCMSSPYFSFYTHFYPIHAPWPHLRAAKLSQRGVVNRAFGFRWIFVAGKKCNVRILRAMRHWNSRIGWPGDGRGDSRHNFKLNSRINGCLCLFRATPKNKRIAALQSDDLFPFACFLDQERVDFLLAQRVFARSFSSVNHLRVVSRPPENLRTFQMIINDHFRLLDAFLRPQRDETEIARPRANKENLSSLRFTCHL